MLPVALVLPLAVRAQQGLRPVDVCMCVVGGVDCGYTHIQTNEATGRNTTTTPIQAQSSNSRRIPHLPAPGTPPRVRRRGGQGRVRVVAAARPQRAHHARVPPPPTSAAPLRRRRRHGQPVHPEPAHAAAAQPPAAAAVVMVVLPPCRRRLARAGIPSSPCPCAHPTQERGAAAAAARPPTGQEGRALVLRLVPVRRRADQRGRRGHGCVCVVWCVGIR